MLYKIILISLVLFSSVCSKAEEKYTDYSIIGGIKGGISLHNSNFLALPNTTTCCGFDNIYFDKALGLNTSIYLGLEKDYDFWNGAKLAVILDVNRATGNYDKQAKIGNWIENDDIKDIISKQILEPAIINLSIVPNFSFYLFDKEKYPLMFNLGVGVGVILSSEYKMHEELISPEEAYFENGLKVRNQQEGAIEKMINPIFYLVGGVKYELFNVNNLMFSPTLSFNYGLTNLVQDISWKQHSLNLGVNVAYRLEKHIPVVEPPIVPDLPKLNIPKQVVTLKLETIVYDDKNTEIANNSSIVIPINVTETIEQEVTLPILFFKKQSAEIVQGYDVNFIEQMKYDEKIVVEIGLAFDETDKIAEERKTKIKEFLHKNSIKTEKIEFHITKSSEKYRHTYIEEEKSFAKFYTNKDDKEYSFAKVNQKTIEKENRIVPQTIQVKSEIEASGQPYNLSANYKINDMEFSSADKNFTITLDENTLDWKNSIPNKNSLDIYIVVNDVAGNERKENLSFSIVPQTKSAIKYVNSNSQKSFTEEYIIGFFDFDKSEFSSIAIDTNIINEHLQNGKKLEIIAYTDDIGTEDYNASLALRRALAGTKLFKNNENIIISTDKNLYRNSNSIYSRFHNRVAIIRVLK